MREEIEKLQQEIADQEWLSKKRLLSYIKKHKRYQKDEDKLLDDMWDSYGKERKLGKRVRKFLKTGTVTIVSLAGAAFAIAPFVAPTIGALAVGVVVGSAAVTLAGGVGFAVAYGGRVVVSTYREGQYNKAVQKNLAELDQERLQILESERTIRHLNARLDTLKQGDKTKPGQDKAIAPPAPVREEAVALKVTTQKLLVNKGVESTHSHTNEG